jgi:hypothetical protein
MVQATKQCLHIHDRRVKINSRNVLFTTLEVYYLSSVDFGQSNKKEGSLHSKVKLSLTLP